MTERAYYVRVCEGGGVISLFVLEMAIFSCIILYNIVNIASTLLSASFLQFSCSIMSLTLDVLFCLQAALL